MSKILPLRDVSSKEDLAVAIVVGRFLEEIDADHGDVTYRQVSFGDNGVLCDLKSRDVDAPAFLTTTKPNRPVSGLSLPYLTLDFEVESEKDFKMNSLAQLRALIPEDERIRAAYFEPRYLIGPHSEKIGRINLYGRR